MDILPEGIVLYAAVVFAVAGLAMGGYFLLRSSPLTPDEREQKRRAHLSQTGRVTEARIIETLEDDSERERGESGISLLRYSYEVRGVEYQASQDVRFYEQRIDLSKVAAGQPASVKFDPQNHANSILLAEDWSGL